MRSAVVLGIPRPNGTPDDPGLQAAVSVRLDIDRFPKSLGARGAPEEHVFVSPRRGRLSVRRSLIEPGRRHQPIGGTLCSVQAAPGDEWFMNKN
jgi:hypothetical protein